jgi:hypothetical protein
MEQKLKIVVALMAALALACVLISPMPDEVPGTAVKLFTLPFVVPASREFDPCGPQLAVMATLPEAELHPTLDVLAATCICLC